MLSFVLHASGNDGFSEAVKPAKMRTASEVGISDMFAIAPPGDWFGTCGGSTAPSPGPSSAVTDDEFTLEMQQFMSLLPLSIDEYGWRQWRIYDWDKGGAEQRRFRTKAKN